MGYVPLMKVDATNLYKSFYMWPGVLILNNFYARLDQNIEYPYKCRVFTRVIEDQWREKEEKVRKICENM